MHLLVPFKFALLGRFEAAHLTSEWVCLKSHPLTQRLRMQVQLLSSLLYAKHTEEKNEKYLCSFVYFEYLAKATAAVRSIEVKFEALVAVCFFV